MDEIDLNQKIVRPHKKIIKNNQRKVLASQKFSLPLQRYPENNLFTLKELIPIED